MGAAAHGGRFSRQATFVASDAGVGDELGVGAWAGTGCGGGSGGCGCRTVAGSNPVSPTVEKGERARDSGRRDVGSQAVTVLAPGYGAAGAAWRPRGACDRRIRVGLAGPGLAFGYESLIAGHPSPRSHENGRSC
jgi:hypothetical protein